MLKHLNSLVCLQIKRRKEVLDHGKIWHCVMVKYSKIWQNMELWY